MAYGEGEEVKANKKAGLTPRMMITSRGDCRSRLPSHN